MRTNADSERYANRHGNGYTDCDGNRFAQCDSHSDGYCDYCSFTISHGLTDLSSGDNTLLEPGDHGEQLGLV
jgi:hypothetical protein